jgi:hypothetical protein
MNAVRGKHDHEQRGRPSIGAAGRANRAFSGDTTS